MHVMRVAVVGLLALATCVGCATGTASVAGTGNGNGHGYGAASPMTEDQQVQQCNGWYDSVAKVCDSIGD